MTLYRTFPDAEGACSIALRAALISGLAKRVYSSIPKKNPVFPLIVVQRLGGVPADRRALDAARVQLDVWGGEGVSKSTLHDLAQAARVVLHEMEGTSVVVPDGPDAFVTGVNDSLGITWQQDSKTGRDRYVFSVTVYLH